jgi:hypothetical protein
MQKLQTPQQNSTVCALLLTKKDKVMVRYGSSTKFGNSIKLPCLKNTEGLTQKALMLKTIERYLGKNYKPHDIGDPSIVHVDRIDFYVYSINLSSFPKIKQTRCITKDKLVTTKSDSFLMIGDQPYQVLYSVRKTILNAFIKN